MKVPWWAIPSLAAIVLTTGSVAAAEGTFSSTGVPLPREVQLSPPGPGTAPVPVTSPTMTTVVPGGGDPAEQVVYPSRPVITQSGPSDATKKTVTPGPGPVSPPTTVVQAGPDPADDEGGGASGPPMSPPTTLAPVTGTTAPPATTTTTTTQPVVPPSTTTTTRPRWGGGGDE